MLIAKKLDARSQGTFKGLLSVLKPTLLLYNVTLAVRYSIVYVPLIHYNTFRAFCFCL